MNDSVTDEAVLVEVVGATATITLNRPDKRNALTQSVLERLLTVLTTVEADDRIRVLVLRGNGPAFCGGMDLAEMLAIREARRWFDYELLHEVLERLASHRNPTIAVVHGAAFAGGCELALHCDIRIGTRNARFAMPLARLGLVAPAYAIQRLIETTGVTIARDLLLTARILDGVAAAHAGLLTRLAPDDELESAVRALTQQIAECAPLSLREMKRALARMAQGIDPETLADLDAARIQISKSTDMVEGLQSFLHRRLPVFRGQ
jgi:enoyl-CoA hydratase/carnithine racemase